MALLVIIGLGFLILSTTELRAANEEKARTEARANARFALMLAIGDVQKSLGPDIRISAPASILDAEPDTPEPNGIQHPHLLGVWQSWGAWLNAEAQAPDGSSLRIADTYARGRPPMFRKWLVSLDPAQARNLDFVETGAFDPENSVKLVGEGSVNNLGDHVRAGLLPVDTEWEASDRIAWWVAGENQKAYIPRNAPSPALSPGETELAHGNAAARDLSGIDGLSGLERDSATAAKLISNQQLPLAGADRSMIGLGLHDFTAHSAGLLADVRWGGLKKDLSLLLNRATLPSELTRDITRARSPRPMSDDLQAENPRIPERGFTSFEQMHAFARQYKDPAIWEGTAPSAETRAFGNATAPEEPEGFYRRMPVISKFYFIFNLQSVPVGQDEDENVLYDCYLTYSPVVQLWNPYNVPLEIDETFKIHTLPYKVMPIRFKTYKRISGESRPFTNFQHWDHWVGADIGFRGFGYDFESPFQNAEDDARVTIGPGEFKIFSFKTQLDGGIPWGAQNAQPLEAGFDPGAAGSARLKVLEGVTEAERPELALQIQPYWVDSNAQWWGGNPGSFCFLARHGSQFTSTGLTIDWFASRPKPNPGNLPPEAGRQDFVSISPDGEASSRARWEFADEEQIPIALIGPVLKTPEELVYDTIDWDRDWRNKTWSQSAPGIDAEQMLATYADADLLELQRMNGAYQMHFQTINGSAELGRVIGHIGENGFLGSTLESPISAVPALEVPTAPVQSLAGFSGLRLQPGWCTAASRQQSGTMNVNTAWRHKITAYKSGVPGLGVGNSFAVPMIPGDQIYQYHDISKSYPDSQIVTIGSPAPQDSSAFSDFWDHALLINDGLWDSWYTSSLADTRRPSESVGQSLSSLLDQIFNQGQPPPNRNFTPLQEASGSAIITDLEQPDGYLRSALYLVNEGAFNVNSTSVDAWYALFTGLRERRAVYRDSSGDLLEITPPAGRALITRHNVETAPSESADPRDGVLVDGLTRWTGVRFLEDAQLRKLAEECVRQVKIRGPFLNMSDFINRRLSRDELGARGALQAAIDYDDLSPAPDSINERFKRGSDMVDSDAAALYPFPEAGRGSMFSAAPGYVVQSDLLKPLGNSLTVRDDTFRIRAYGESRNPDGSVLARAYCEAIVQRTTDYVDPANDPTLPAIELDAEGNPTGTSPLSDLNQSFGRSFRIISFNWLSPNEV